MVRATGRAARTLRLGTLAVAVALVLADSSVVVLALPAVLGTFRASIADVAWVLVAFKMAAETLAVEAAT